MINKKAYTIFWLVEKYNNASKYLKFDVPNAKEFNENKLLNIVEELKKYKTFLKEYDFNSFYWNGLDTYNLNFIDIDSFINILEDLKLHWEKWGLNEFNPERFITRKELCVMLDNCILLFGSKNLPMDINGKMGFKYSEF